MNGEDGPLGESEALDDKPSDLEYSGPITHTLYSAVARRYLAETPDKHKVLLRPTTGGGYARGPDDVLQVRHRRALDVYPFEEDPNLPSSDILTSIHYLFASRLRPDICPSNRGMYEETSLIAMGIMLEETIKDALGPVGHLLYATQCDDDGDDSP